MKGIMMMEYTKEDLEKKIIEIHPEIAKKGLSLDLKFEADRNAWIIGFAKGDKSRYAFLDKRDADECMAGKKCIYLWGLIDQYALILDQD
jgi:hypothetical protein